MKAMAYAQGADYLEQDLVMTKDDQLVVLHDHYLDRVTDVAERFPDRARKDGRFYAIDFTLAEIRSLKFTEGFEIENGKKVQVYPGRFPMGKSDFRIHTFQEEIEFVQGLNHSTEKISVSTRKSKRRGSIIRKGRILPRKPWRS